MNDSRKNNEHNYLVCYTVALAKGFNEMKTDFKKTNRPKGSLFSLT